jgi:hypothetical protein
VDSVRTGGEPPPQVDDDTQNAIIYAEYRDRPAAEILTAARQSWDRVAAAIEACSEDELMRPHPHGKDRTISDSGPANAGHLGIHLMFWYRESGDDASAEAAMRWAYELEIAAPLDAKARAYASYNLACFYAVVGRAGEAVPLLRDSFDGAPELVDWAHKDADLDPIRGDREIASLLAG